MLAQARDHVEREIGALELRIGIEDDRHIDRIGDGAEIAFDLRLGEREIGFENGENAGGAELLVAPRLVTASPVAVAATPATTGTRPAAASMVARTTSMRCTVRR